MKPVLTDKHVLQVTRPGGWRLLGNGAPCSIGGDASEQGGLAGGGEGTSMRSF